MVYIILLNWNNFEDTLACVSSLFRMRGPTARVIVCDNASTDGSFERLNDWCLARSESMHRSDSGVTFGFKRETSGYIADMVLIQTGSNLGYAGGNNVGIKYALHQADMKYVWLLNNDTETAPNALNCLIERYQAATKPGICGSKLIYFDRRDKVQAYGGKYSKWLAVSRHIGAGSDPNEPVDSRAVDAEMDYVVGASMLVSREFLDVVGLLNEQFFLYFEELDWAARAKKEGFELLFASESHVFHKEGGTINKGKKSRSPVSEYFYLRNRLLITKLHFPAYLIPVWLAGCLIALRRILAGKWQGAGIAIAVLIGHEPSAFSDYYRGDAKDDL